MSDANNNKEKPVYYLSLDLETTGLKPEGNHILEVDAILLDSNLNETVYPFHSYVVPNTENPIETIESSLDEFTRKMHKKNDLLRLLKVVVQFDQKCLPTPKVVEQRLLKWLENELKTEIESNGEWPEIRLAGHSINSLDKPFLAYHMPDFHAKLSHRTLDISAFIRFLKDVCKVKYEHTNKEVVHRASDDNREAVKEIKFIKEYIDFAEEMLKFFGKLNSRFSPKQQFSCMCNRKY